MSDSALFVSGQRIQPVRGQGFHKNLTVDHIYSPAYTLYFLVVHCFIAADCGEEVLSRLLSLRDLRQYIARRLHPFDTRSLSGISDALCK